MSQIIGSIVPSITQIFKNTFTHIATRPCFLYKQDTISDVGYIFLFRRTGHKEISYFLRISGTGLEYTVRNSSYFLQLKKDIEILPKVCSLNTKKQCHERRQNN